MYRLSIASGPCQFLFRKSGPDSKKYKGIKAGSKKISLTFGHDLQMGDALHMANRVLVGQVQGRTYTATRLRQWILEIWGQVLEVLPGVVTLSRGWFALHFQRPEYIPWVLSKLWHIELAPVLLKRWSPVFDPELEHLGAGPIWVRLPGLPLHFWSEDVFKHIGNALGTYLDYDKSNMAMARILVDLDKHKGWVENLQIQWRNTCCIQILNYEEVPYRCRGCHKIWPWFNYCPLRTSSSASVSQLDHIVVDIPSGSQDKRPAKTAGHPPKTSAQMHGPREEPVRPPSPRITRSRAAAAAINPGSATSFLTNYPKRPRT